MRWPRQVSNRDLFHIPQRFQVGIDVSTTPRQAGYIADNSSITGISLMHDEGTGGNTAGGYGIFPLFPLANCTFVSCPVGITSRAALRAAGADGAFFHPVFMVHFFSDGSLAAASPGYFTTTFIDGRKIETTSTRRAGLIRFTYPASSTTNHVVVDLSNDLQRSFHGGRIVLNDRGHVLLDGIYSQVIVSSSSH